LFGRFFYEIKRIPKNLAFMRFYSSQTAFKEIKELQYRQHGNLANTALARSF